MLRVKKVSYPATHLLNAEVTGVHTTVTHRSHTAVTYRGHRGSHNCHTQESQAVAQLLHGEIKGVIQREENNKINIHRNAFPIGFVGVTAFAA